MGIWGLSSSLLPRHIPGFFSLWRTMHFQNLLPQLGLETWITRFLRLPGCLFTSQCRNAHAMMLGCWWNPSYSSMPRSVHSRNCPPRASGDNTSPPGVRHSHPTAQHSLTAFPKHAGVPSITEVWLSHQTTTLSIIPAEHWDVSTPNILRPYQL